MAGRRAAQAASLRRARYGRSSWGGGERGRQSYGTDRGIERDSRIIGTSSWCVRSSSAAQVFVLSKRGLRHITCKDGAHPVSGQRANTAWWSTRCCGFERCGQMAPRVQPRRGEVFLSHRANNSTESEPRTGVNSICEFSTQPSHCTRPCRAAGIHARMEIGRWISIQSIDARVHPRQIRRRFGVRESLDSSTSAN